MQLLIDNKPAGLAVWGWGIMPKSTPTHLFKNNVCNVKDYLELCRFFVYDWCPKNTPSKFLAITHRLIKKHAPWVKWLYTYAAGFQGLIGHIYKGSGYDYIGRQECSSFIYVPSIGLLHWVAIWHRYHLPVGSGRVGKKMWPEIHKLWPEAKRWSGYNFRYIYWLCDNNEKQRLLKNANFTVQKYPTEKELEIWLEDEKGIKINLTPEFAKSIPIVKLKTKRSTSKDSVASGFQPEEGGASPTVELSKA